MYVFGRFEMGSPRGITMKSINVFPLPQAHPPPTLRASTFSSLVCYFVVSDSGYSSISPSLSFHQCLRLFVLLYLCGKAV
jgi:hypothetical protein